MAYDARQVTLLHNATVPPRSLNPTADSNHHVAGKDMCVCGVFCA
jgi:hypothetical protein